MTLIDLGLLCLFPVIFILAKAFDRKEWVGLTDDEILLAGYAGVSLKTVKWAEAKLKEKNT